MKNKIKLLRKERHLTQEELAQTVGISRTALVMIENNRSDPDGRTIAKLVKALRVPANKIFEELDYKV